MISEPRISNFVVGVSSSVSRSFPSFCFLYSLVQAPSPHGQHSFFLAIDNIFYYHELSPAILLQSIVSFLFIMAEIFIFVLTLA